jgi:hypothetical protein
MGKLISLNGRVICVRLAKPAFANRLRARAEEGAFQNGNGPWEDGGTEVMGHGSLRSQLGLNYYDDPGIPFRNSLTNNG